METTQKKILAAIISLTLLYLGSPFAFAADPETPSDEVQGFGKFEVGLPGVKEQSIDAFLDTNSKKPILAFTNALANAVIAILVIIGVISIVMGGYIYMTAGGDASRLKTAKEMIVAALVGILISLISVVILNTINKYLGTEAREPTLGTSPAPGANTGTESSSQEPSVSSGSELPISNTITEGSVGTRLQQNENRMKAFEDGKFNFNASQQEEGLKGIRDIMQAEINRIETEITRLNQSSSGVTILIDGKNDLQRRLNNFATAWDIKP